MGRSDDGDEEAGEDPLDTWDAGRIGVGGLWGRTGMASVGVALAEEPAASMAGWLRLHRGVSSGLP
jgi:hypothetical protein